jgi:biopolymer transport protein TolQ
LRTCVFLALAFQGQGGAPPSGAAAESNIVSLVLQSSPLSKGVLLILFDIFRRSSKFSEVQAVCNTLRESPLVGMFLAGYAELTTQLKSAPASASPVAVAGGEARPSTTAVRPTLRSLDALDRALLRSASAEMSRLEKRLTFLATTAAITPFIGLFGTVWGILMSFQEIGQAGSTSLAVVGPGIADALVATAVGLFAAIPAVYFYNHFTYQLKQFATAMDDFSMEFLTIAERNFT